MSRGPLNYTTTIDSVKTAGECVARLAEHGASAIAITYAHKRPIGLSFRIDTVHGPRQFDLPVNWRGTYAALQQAYRHGDIQRRFATEEQAERVSWRVLKDWLEAQLALIEAGISEMAEVMLPYMQVGDGRTLYRAFVENERLALPGGES